MNPLDQELSRPQHDIFEAKIDALVNEAEDIRLRLMRLHQSRAMLSTTLSILLVLIGAGIFGWLFLYEGRLILGVLCVAISIALSIVIHFWAEKPLQMYKRNYKRIFMPKLAKALGGFQFFQSRGISAKFLGLTGVVPRHALYRAEDCFMGRYKGVKVIFSEARLYADPKGHNPVFDGIFVLLEAQEEIFRGHTILTTDLSMVDRYAGKRWQKLQAVGLPDDSAYTPAFKAFSDRHEMALKLSGDAFLKELLEASKIFEDAPITAVMFRRKFVFLMIPYAHDMFEPSTIDVPIRSKSQAMQCKREIEQILEIIDVFGFFQSADSRIHAGEAASPDQNT
ncbi:MAG: DUF3137 domain-containing protein [Bdellovibrionales bacterium]